MKPFFKLFIIFMVTILLSSLFLGNVKEGILTPPTTANPKELYIKLEQSSGPDYRKTLLQSYDTDRNASYVTVPINSPLN